MMEKVTKAEAILKASIISLIDLAANPKHTSKNGYVKILMALHTDIVLRLAAMGIDVTEGN